MLSYILPVFGDRLAQQEMVESSEEIRYLLSKTLVAIASSSRESFASFVDDCVKILARTLADPYQDVRKEACKLVVQLAQHNPRPLAFHGAAVAKSILPCLQHRHSSVRIAGIMVCSRKCRVFLTK